MGRGRDPVGFIRVEVEDRIAVVTIDRPPVNALNSELIRELPRLVGAGWASQMIFTGEMIDAATAERIGLVNRVTPPGELLPQAKAIARAIVEKAPRAVALSKAAIHAAQEMSLGAGLSFETEAFGLAGATADKREGMTAFLEKRKPAFKNE